MNECIEQQPVVVKVAAVSRVKECPQILHDHVGVVVRLQKPIVVVQEVVVYVIQALDSICTEKRGFYLYKRY